MHTNWQFRSAGLALTVTGACPRCGDKLVVRRARADYQPFIGCDGFPSCRFTCPYDAALEALRRQVAHQPPAPPLAHQAVHRELTRLITLAHPDKWHQGQPATALAHELTTALLALRTRLEEDRP